MSNVPRQSSVLSSQKRILIEARLKQKGITLRKTSVIAPGEKSDTYPLSFAQQRLWFLDQLEPESSAYNIPIAVHLRGPVDRAALEQSLKEVVRRHESLRTIFQFKADQPVQVIVGVETFSLPWLDLAALQPEQREKEARQLQQQEGRQPFDLARGPLLRATLACLRQEEHLLLLTMHHIVSDGWSMNVFVREVTALYDAFVAGQPSPLPDLPIQYTDFALWQHRWLQGELLEEQIRYWVERLGGLSSLELPIDYVRPAVQTYRGAHESLLLPFSLLEDLKHLSQREGVTLFMTVLAAFQVLLSRYSGQRDLAIGTDIANRTHAEIEGLIGFFVNTLVLRTDLTGNPSFLDLLQRVSETCLGAYAHQDVPFEKLVEVLHPERDLSRSPLFQVFLTVQQASPTAAATSLHGLTLSRQTAETATAKFDLSLALSETQRGLSCVMEYNTDLFEAARIRQVLHHFQTLLTAIAQRPEARLLHLPLLSEEQRQQLLDSCAGPTRPFAPSLSVCRLFEHQVACHPERVALAFQQQQLTYGDLNRRANHLALVLRERGVGTETLVGLYQERTPEMVLSLLAIFKAGAAYVPLDPAYPSERLAFVMEEAQLSVLLTTRALLATLPASPRPPLLCLEDYWLTVSSTRDEDEERALEQSLAAARSSTGEELAYVIYTSGSTGRPKGAMVQQAGMLNHLFAKMEALQLREHDLVMQTASHCFDISVWQFLAGLLVGGQVHLVSDEQAHDPESLWQQVVTQGSTILEVVPSLLHHLLDIQRVREHGRDDVLGLRWLLVTGEAVSAQLCERWLDGFPSIPLLNAYGPTECSDDVTHARIEQVPAPGQSGIPIGYPVGNMQVFLLDGQLEPVPVGVVGQMYVGGIGVGRGYLRDPARTAALFLPDPHSQQAGRRLYQTGDLGRHQADGQIQFLGRVDDQVKVRGFRIELGEIKAALQRHEQVGACEVLEWEVRPQDVRLVAYVVGRDQQTPAAAELRRYLSGKLPEYMVPSFFVALDALPVTANGKVDRRALPAPGMQEEDCVEQREGAQNPLEEVVTAIWKEVLGREQVDRAGNFFAQGGHSLLATQVIARVRAILKVEIALRTFFEAPTIIAVRAQVEAALRQQQGVQIPPLVPVARTQRLPLSFAQQRLWFLDRLQPGNAAYTIANAVRLHGQLDTVALARSLGKIVQRHESLRTSFLAVEGQPMQVIADVVETPLLFIDLSILTAEQREAEAQRLTRQETRRPFDLSRGPLLRATLLLLEKGDEYALLLTMHHIISDGWSMGVFVRELSSLYRAFVTGQPSPLPELPIQYADFTLWQRQWLQGEVLATQLNYWTRQLRGITPLKLPYDRPRPAIQSYRGASYSFKLPADLSNDLVTLSRQEGVTLFMTLLTAFQTLLYRYTGQLDIVVGTDIANRTQLETENLIGFFVNLLVLRTDLSGTPSFREVLRRVHDMLLGAYTHQDTPFEMLVERLEPGHTTDRMPLAQVLFVLQNIPSSRTQDLPAVTLSTSGNETNTAKFDVALFMQESSMGLRGSIVYSTDLFDASTIAVMANRFEMLLQSIIVHPDIPVDTLDVSIVREKEHYEQKTLKIRKELKISRGERIDLSKIDLTN